MSMIGDGVTSIKTFFSEVRAELKKSAWPARSELVESTIVIVVSVLILGAFVGASDGILASVINMLLKA